MYRYIVMQWTTKNVSADWVMRCVPKFITIEQCATILALPQNGVYAVEE